MIQRSKVFIMKFECKFCSNWWIDWNDFKIRVNNSLNNCPRVTLIISINKNSLVRHSLVLIRDNLSKRHPRWYNRYSSHFPFLKKIDHCWLMQIITSFQLTFKFFFFLFIARLDLSSVSVLFFLAVINIVASLFTVWVVVEGENQRWVLSGSPSTCLCSSNRIELFNPGAKIFLLVIGLWSWCCEESWGGGKQWRRREEGRHSLSLSNTQVSLDYNCCLWNKFIYMFHKNIEKESIILMFGHENVSDWA